MRERDFQARSLSAPLARRDVSDNKVDSDVHALVLLSVPHAMRRPPIRLCARLMGRPSPTSLCRTQVRCRSRTVLVSIKIFWRPPRATRAVPLHCRHDRAVAAGVPFGRPLERSQKPRTSSCQPPRSLIPAAIRCSTPTTVPDRRQDSRASRPCAFAFSLAVAYPRPVSIATSMRRAVSCVRLDAPTFDQAPSPTRAFRSVE